MGKKITIAVVVIVMAAVNAEATRVTRGQWGIDYPSSSFWFDIGDSTMFLFSGIGDSDNHYLSLWRRLPNSLAKGDMVTVTITAPEDQFYRLNVGGFDKTPSSWTTFNDYSPPYNGAKKISIPVTADCQGGILIFLSVSATPPWRLGEKFNIAISEIRVGKYLIDGFSRISTGVASSPLHQPTEFILRQNYPNPFNSSTTIRFDLPEASEATLAIYNINGQLIRTLASGFYSAGEHKVVWDGRDEFSQPVPSGVYLYRLVTAGQTTTKKMNLLK